MTPTLSQDQQNKKEYVLNAIANRCSELSDRFDCFQRIQESLQAGDVLRADTITGGLTNYAYKIYLENDSEVAVFAKLAFPYALWNPDKSAHFDVQRLRNEYDMMETFARLAPGCVPTPFFCEEVDGMMILVAEWSDNDEQLAEQVIAGNMDARVARELARSIAKLHCVTDFDPDFNNEIRTTMISSFDTQQKKMETMFNSFDSSSRAVSMVQRMGLKECTALVDTAKYHYEHSRECLVHADLHVKNILVEKMATTGAFSVIDWEMAFAGPVGRDLGFFFPFLLCTALAHTLRGDQAKANSLLKTMDLVWEEYAQGLREGGKTEDFIRHAFQSTLGWCGRFMFLGYYTSGANVEDFPVESEQAKEILMDSIGVLGLKFMQWGFGSTCANTSTRGMRALFKTAIWTEAAVIVSLLQEGTTENKENMVPPTIGLVAADIRRDSATATNTNRLPSRQTTTFSRAA